MSKTKYKKQNENKIINTETKVAVCRCITSQRKKKDGLYNTYHELLSEKWMVKRSRFHASYIISPQSVPIFATSHLVGCIEYYYNNLEDKVDKVKQHNI